MAVRMINIPCGSGGLNGSASLSLVDLTELREARNLSFEADSWQKEGGASKINTTVISGAPKIYGLVEFGFNKVAGTSDGKIITVVTGGIGTTLKSSLGTNKLSTFIETIGATSTKKLFHFNGYNTVQVWDGVAGNTSDIATPPADWTSTNHPMAGVSHNNRLWSFMNHRVYYSTLSNHEDFNGTGSGTLEIFPGEGEKIVAGISFANRLWIFKKPKGIYYIDDNNPDSGYWQIRRHNSEIGMSGPLGLTLTDTEVFFLSSEARIHALSRVQEFGGITSGAIMPEKISKWLRDNVKYTLFDKTIAVYYPYKSEIHFAITDVSGTDNNIRLVLDLHDPETPKFRSSDRDVVCSLSTFTDANGKKKLMSGDDAGFVRELDTVNKNKDGAGYNCLFETPEFSPIGLSDMTPLGTGKYRVALQFLELVFEPKGIHDLNVEVYGDGEYRYTATFTMGGESGGTLGSFILGTSMLGGGKISNTRRKLFGEYRRIKLKGYNNSANEDFSIFSMLLGYTIGSDRV